MMSSLRLEIQDGSTSGLGTATGLMTSFHNPLLYTDSVEFMWSEYLLENVLSLTRQVAHLQEQLSEREEELGDLKAERNNTRVCLLATIKVQNHKNSAIHQRHY
ncbi:unnamed protein product [Protopolystoma xenopodis]|uniref:Uncharacterized protein n=1 Tax=Protopolystoma xenopodis TaxID=117903 RepID=A0A3S5CTE0_9PLAT|nr:unnamed protein product [Protopolystoma xenopodis]